MPQSVIVPCSAVTSYSGVVTVVGTGPATAILNGSGGPGGNWLQAPTPNGLVRLDFAWPTLPANAVISGLRFTIFSQSAATLFSDYIEVHLDVPGSPGGTFTIPLSNSTVAVQGNTSLQAAIGANPLTPANIGSIYALWNATTAAAELFNFGVTLYYDTPPSVVVAVNSGTHGGQADGSGQHIGLIYSDPQGEGQGVCRAYGLDAVSGSVVFDSGVLYQSSPVITTGSDPSTAIFPNAEIVWWAQAGNVATYTLGTPGFLDVPVTGAGQPGQAAPATPTVAAAWDSVNARVLLTVTGYDNLLTESGSGAAAANLTVNAACIATTSGINASSANSTASGPFGISPTFPPGCAPVMPGALRFVMSGAANPSATFKPIPVVAGKPLTMFAWYAPYPNGAPALQGGFNLIFYNATGGVVATVNPAAYIFGTYGAWTYLQTAVSAVPAGAVTVVVNPVWLGTPNAGDLHFLAGLGLYHAIPAALIANGTTAAALTVPTYTVGGAINQDAGDTTGGAKIYVQRSTDGGATWQPVRAASPLSGLTAAQTATVIDTEAPPNTLVVYRARTVLPRRALSYLPVASRWTPTLDNAGFESYVTGPAAVTAPWGGTVALDTARPHPGPGSHDLALTVAVTGTTQTVTPLFVTPAQTTIRWAGAWRVDNAAAARLLINFWSYRGGSLVGSAVAAGPTTTSSVGNGWQTFDTADVTIPAGTGYIELAAQATGSGDGVTTGLIGLDDLTVAFGPGYLTTGPLTTDRLRCPEVPSWDIPVTVEPVNANGSAFGSSSIAAVNSEQARTAQLVLYGEGARNPAVVSPVRASPLYKGMIVTVLNDAHRQVMEAMLNSNRVLLWQSCAGDAAGQQAYVVATGSDQMSRIVTQDQNNGQRYRYIVDFQTVGAP